MKRVVVLGLVASFLAIVAACKRGGEHTCASDPQAGCLCKNESFQLGPTQKPAKECVPPSGAAAFRCCHDLDSKGESTGCWCERALCIAGTTGNCRCEMTGSLSAGENVVAACEPKAEQKCCQHKETGKCLCAKWSVCPSEHAQVDQCLPAAVKPGACLNPGPHDAKSCDGLKWRSKT